MNCPTPCLLTRQSVSRPFPLRLEVHPLEDTMTSKSTEHAPAAPGVPHTETPANHRRVGAPPPARGSWWPGLLLLSLAWGVAGCGSDASDVGAGSGTDLPDLFTTEEILSIGAVDGAPAVNFGGISDVHELADGRIVVADCQAGELRFFDEGGAHLASVGALGQGPGEFGSLDAVFPARADSIAVYDRAQRRLSVFTPQGVFSRSFGVAGVMPGFRVEGALSDGRFVGFGISSRGEGEVGTVVRSEVTLVVLDPAGHVIDSIGPVDGPRYFARTASLGLWVRLGEQHYFTASLAGAAYSNGSSPGPLLLLLPSLLDSTRVVPLAPPRAISPEDRQRWTERYEAQSLMPDGSMVPTYSEEFADTATVHGDMYLDDDGGLWLQDPVLPWAYPLTYTRYVDGQASIRVELPPRFFPLELSTDGVLGVEFDELGVQRVKRLALVPGATASEPRDATETAPILLPGCGVGTSR